MFFPDLQHRERIWCQLPLQARAWIQRHANRIVAAGRYGVLERRHLHDAIQVQVLRLRLEGSNARTVPLLLEALVLQRVVATGGDATLHNVEMQEALQKQQQALEMLPTISRWDWDPAGAVVRKISG